jgi:hypothetical protein
MPLADDDVVKALAADRPDGALDVAILPGERGAVRTSVIPNATTVSRTAASKTASRSCSRSRGVTHHGSASGVVAAWSTPTWDAA